MAWVVKELRLEPLEEVWRDAQRDARRTRRRADRAAAEVAAALDELAELATELTRRPRARSAGSSPARKRPLSGSTGWKPAIHRIEPSSGYQ